MVLVVAQFVLEIHEELQWRANRVAAKIEATIESNIASVQTLRNAELPAPTVPYAVPYAEPLMVTHAPHAMITNKQYIRLCDATFKCRSSHNLQLPLRKNAIVCVQGTKAILQEFFSLNIDTPFTLVTIETDEATPQNKKWLQHKHLTAWYGWNSVHPDVIPIPIGLNEDTQLEPVKNALIHSPKIEKLLISFLQHNSERQALYTQVKSLSYAHIIPYVKMHWKPNDLQHYYESMSKYKWILCPRGTGQDTHRVWEALYLGSIPVVLKSSISSLYDNLPVIQLDSWSQLSLSVLKQLTQTLPSSTDNAYWNHWQTKIQHDTTVPYVEALPGATIGQVRAH